MLFWDHYQMLCNYNKHREIDQSKFLLMKYICILNFIENHFLTFLLQFNSRERWPVRPADQTHRFDGLDPDLVPTIQRSEGRLCASVSFNIFGKVVTRGFAYNFLAVKGIFLHESRVDGMAGK